MTYVGACSSSAESQMACNYLREFVSDLDADNVFAYTTPKLIRVRHR